MRVVKVSVAPLALAMLLLTALSGCSGTKDDGKAALQPSTSTPAAPVAPVLYLNVTVGNHTFPFTTAAMPQAPSTTGHAGNATSSSASATSHAMGNMTMDAGAPSGHAPLNVTFAVGAAHLPAGQAVRWSLDFGESAGNASKAATAGANGTRLPGTADHTFTAPGLHNVTFSLRIGNGTAQTLTAGITVLNATVAGVKPGTVVGKVVLDQSGTMTAAVQGVDCSSSEGVSPSASFPWEFPAKDANGTAVAVKSVAIELDQGSTNFDSSLHFIGPDGKEIQSADASSLGSGTTETLKADGPFPAGTYTVSVVGCVVANGSFTIHGEGPLVAT